MKYYVDCSAGPDQGPSGGLWRPSWTSWSLGLLLGAGGLLGEEDGLDVGQDAALGDGDAGQQLVQLLVIPGTKV